MARKLNIKKIYNSGFKDLVRIRKGQKAPREKKWPKVQLSSEDVDQALANGETTFGLKARRFPGVDIDIPRQGMADGVRKLAIETLGMAPTRFGDKPKSLLIYRTDKPFKKFALRAVSKDNPATKWSVEILGDGQQYIIAGDHPNGFQYEYEVGQDLDLIDPQDLTEITEADAADFLNALKDMINPAKWTVTITHGESATDVSYPAPESLLAPSLDAVRECVEAATNDLSDYDTFIQFVFAIRGATGGSMEGFKICVEWADRWPEGQKPGVLEKLWQATPRLGWDKLQEMAKSSGAPPGPIAQGDFPVIENPNAPNGSKSPFVWADVYSAAGIVEYLIRTDILSDVRYERRIGSWWAHEAGRWQEPGKDKGKAVVESKLAPVIERMAEWVVQQDGDDDDTIKKILTMLRQPISIYKNLKECMERSPKFWIENEEFDVPKTTNHLLNTPAGTYNLTTGVKQPHDHHDHITHITNVSPLFDSTKHPIWSDLLNKASGFDAEVVDFLHRYLGSSVGGHSDSQKIMLLLYGDPDSGKSSITNTVLKILNDYGMVTADSSLLVTPGSKYAPHATEVAYMLSARFSVANEGTHKKEWNSPLLKQITGGDIISSRKMFENAGRANNKTYNGRACMSTNEMPRVDMLDEGMRARLAVLELHAIANADPKAKTEMQKEAPYILGWLMEGYQKDQERSVEDRTTWPQALLEATEESFSDPMSEFVATALDFDTTSYTAPGDLREAYNRTVDLPGQIDTDIQFGLSFRRVAVIVEKLAEDKNRPANSAARFKKKKTTGFVYRVAIKENVWSA